MLAGEADKFRDQRRALFEHLRKLLPLNLPGGSLKVAHRQTSKTFFINGMGLVRLHAAPPESTFNARIRRGLCGFSLIAHRPY